MFTVSLAHLLSRGVSIEPHEAVAIAQSLIESPAGTPTPANVEIRSDGSARCMTRQGTATIAAVARLIEDLLLANGRVPATLRYALARGTGAVEASPFETMDAFSAALRRFEQGDHKEVIRALLHRIAESRTRPVAPVTATIATHDVDAQATRSGTRAWRFVAIIALLICCAAVGFTSTNVLTGRHREVAQQPAPPRREAVPRAGRDTASIASLPPSAVAARAPAATGRHVAAPRLRPERAIGRDGDSALSPAFSSEGTARLDDDLRIIKVVDDRSRNYHAQPSPDGRLIAFDSDRDGERGIYISNADGSDVHRISGPGSAAVPTWSPDGSRIVYTRAEADRPAVWNLWVQPAAGGTPRRLTSDRSGAIWGASWFPDGRRVAYSHRQSLTVLDLQTRQSRTFASPVKGALVRAPAVSPDGAKVVFQVLRHGAWMLDLTEGSMVCVLADPTAEEFAWSPDGRRIAFHSRRDGAWGIYMLHRG